MESIVSSSDGTLVTIEVETRMGDKYSFPAMDKEALGKILPKGSNRIPESTPALAMVNTSYAVLSIPFSIIKAIRVEGESWWDCPV